MKLLFNNNAVLGPILGCDIYKVIKYFFLHFSYRYYINNNNIIYFEYNALCKIWGPHKALVQSNNISIYSNLAKYIGEILILKICEYSRYTVLKMPHLIFEYFECLNIYDDTFTFGTKVLKML